MAEHLKFTFGAFILRWIAAVFVVFATYNPTGYSYYHWLLLEAENWLPLKVLAGLMLGTSYLVAVRISRIALGNSGFVTALLAALLFSFGLVSLVSPGTRFAETVRYLHLISIATAIAVGMSWSHIKHRVTGQRTARYVS
jgi:hypothetical protein